jgi:UvrD-like helicase C-terminal domain
VAQTGDPAGTSSWAQVLEPYVGDRWRLAELTVNYRTPAEIMALAARVLTEIDPAVAPPHSVRETGVEPWLLGVPPDRLAERLVEVVRREADEIGGGRLGILVPTGGLRELGRAIADALPGAAVGGQPDPDDRVAAGPVADGRIVDSPVVMLTVRQAKGLEFDSVVVVDPGRIVAESTRGHSDLYVALTRPTRRLGVLYPGDLPAALAPGGGREPDAPARAHASRVHG